MSWTDGYLTWERSFLRRPMVIAGFQLGECRYSFSAEKPEAGNSIEMLAGGSVYQQTPASARAPLDLEPETYEVTVQATLEEDYFRVRRLLAQVHRRPVEIFLDDPIEDVWPITPDPQTLWTLSRWLPYSLIAWDPLDVEAWIADDPESGFDADPLTVVNAAGPAAGEIYVPNDSKAIQVETPDLSASAGRFLILRYSPLRQLRVDAFSREIRVANGLEWTMALTEIVPNRDY